MLNIPKIPVKNNKENSTRYVFSIDLGTQFIKIALIAYFEENNTKIITHKSINYNEINPALLDEENTLQIVDKVKKTISEIKDETGINAKDAIIGIPAFKITSQTTTIRIKREKPNTKITKKEIEEVTNKIIIKAREEALQELLNKTANFNSEIELINSDITFIKIDGYITKELEGFRGNILEISFFTSFAPSEYLQYLVSLTNKLNLNLLTITPNIYAVNKTLIDKTDNNHIIIDIGGKYTDIAIVFAGEIVKIVSFNLGAQSIINYTKELTDKGEEEIRTNIENEHSSEINPYKYEIEQVWISSLISALKNIEQIKVFPGEVLIIGGGSKYISKEILLESLNSLNFKDSLTVSYLSDLEDPKMKNIEAISNFGNRIV